MSLIVGLITAACNPGTTSESATLGGSAGASESSSGTVSASDAIPTSGMSASNSEGPDGTASNSESDSNLTANNSESDSDPTASASASASDSSVTDSASASDSSASASDGSAGTTGSVGDTSAGSSDGASTSGASTAGGTDPSAGPSGGEGSASDTDGVPECTPSECNGQIFACGDCQDNDGDGMLDCADPDCFGPCDDSESELGSPIEEKDPCKQDCYFDGDGGQGGADCQWNIKCDPKEPDPFYCPYNGWVLEDGYGKCVDGDPATCQDNCTAPPGCDCFGCCMFPDDNPYFIGSPNCTLDNYKDTCAPCTPMYELCGNQCDPKTENCFPNPEQNECPM
jgi:hypothetical protein